MMFLSLPERWLALCPVGTFTIGEVLQRLRDQGSRCAASTIRTHVTPRRCANAPNHHAVTYNDLYALGSGRYTLNGSG